MCINSALLFIAIFLIINGTKLGCKMNIPNKVSGCMRVCVCVGVSSHQSSIVYRGFNKPLISLMYSTDAVFWNETIAPNRCACFFPPELSCFCSDRHRKHGLGAQQVHVSFAHTRLLLLLCLCHMCWIFQQPTVIHGSVIPPPLRVYLWSESALHSKQCEIDDCVLSGLVWEEQCVWQFMALSRCTRLSVQHPLLFPEQSLWVLLIYLLFTISQHALILYIEVPANRQTVILMQKV